MSRTFKDRPYRLGGQKHPYYVAPDGHAEFTRQCRRQARAQAKAALRSGVEPEPRYPGMYAYFD